MPEELVCPDCGGVVGTTETSDAGRPCTCFASINASHGSSLTGQPVEGAGGAEGAPLPVVQKICIACGKDVSGHRRVKDSRGYTCYDCAKAEIQKERGDRVRCRSCGRLAKDSLLEDYEGTKMCPQCMAERKNLQKEQIKRIGIMSARNRFETSRMAILGGLGMLLFLIILLHSLHLF